MPLTDAQLERYARHIVLKEIGGQGQQKLLNARVLVIGAGGLGAPCLMYLAAAGVGTLGVIDHDAVSLSNLQRQIIHDTASLGRPKVESAKAHLARLNPDVKVETHDEQLTAANALDIVSRYDIVADGCDNFATRFLVNDACHLARVTLVSGAVGPFEGQVSTFKSHLRDAEGKPYPNYRDLVGEAPPPGSIPACEEAGVLGALTGVVGSLMALEVIKEITGSGTSLAGRLLIYDALETRFRTLTLRHDPQNPLSGEHATIRDLSVHG
ncbi:MAG: HesA/MoeB/ThiF family protein [Parvibaculum sp.]|uniref:HesA/MoeB/ThiF family protein n=1 Tax=Parvibaculum sp. TaxID=2024848 RepID=UPI003C7921B3